LSQLDFSQANYLASGDRFIGQFRFHFEQIIVIEKSKDAPRAHNFNKFSPRTAP